MFVYVYVDQKNHNYTSNNKTIRACWKNDFYFNTNVNCFIPLLSFQEVSKLRFLEADVTSLLGNLKIKAICRLKGKLLLLFSLRTVSQMVI